MPDWPAYVRERLKLPGLRPEREAEIIEEIARQLEDAYQESIRLGLSRAEAEAVAAAHINDWDALSAALRSSPKGKMPTLDRLAERAAVRVSARPGLFGLLGSFWRDARYGLRLLGKNRGFAFAAILIMALGIAANTAVFSIIDSTLFFHLPYPHSSRIVFAGRHDEFTFRPWAKDTKTFAAISADIETNVTLTGRGEPERLLVAKVTSGFFRVLGVQPMLGRAFLPSETKSGGPDIAILTYGLWRTGFRASPTAIGATVRLDDRLYTIIGVMPKGFEFPHVYNSSPALLLPLQSFSTLVLGPKGNVVSVSTQMAGVLGRLKPGISPAQAQAELQAIAKATRYRFSRESAKVIALHDYLVAGAKSKVLLFWGAVGFLLLIACLNVANLALARALEREKEVAVRVALGADRWRVASQLLTESVVLSTLGGLAGIAIAYAVVVLARNLGPADIPRLSQATINLPVLGLTIAVAVLAGILAGLAPVRGAWRMATVEGLKEGARTTAGRSHRRLRSALVVTEIGTALILVIGAGLLAGSYLRLTSVPTNLDPHDLLTAQVELPQGKYTNAMQQTEFEESVLTSAKGLRQVRAAAVTDSIPGEWLHNFSSIAIEGRPIYPDSKFTNSAIITASPGLFHAAGIRILEGREFLPTDTATAKQVAVVNQAFVARYFPGIEPLGRKVRKTSDKEWATIVGVVADTPKGEPPVIYLPYAQHPVPSLTFLIRTSGSPLAVVPALRARVEELDSGLPVFGVATMEHLLGAHVATQRFETVMFGAFALVALALAALGVYGVISYSVSERTHEIGIRMALGAGKEAVMRMVVTKTLALALAGISIGLAGSLALTRYLQSLLYDIRPDDPWTFALATGVLILVALLAGFLPAWRATEIDPITALRCE